MKRRIVFAGDSITHGGPWQYWLSEHYVTNFAFPGHTTKDMTLLIPNIVESEPEILSVMIGTNDFGKYRLSVDEVTDNILKLASSIRSALPVTPIIWSSLTPRSDEFSSSVMEVNSRIKPVLDAGGFIYFDAFSLLKDSEKNTLKLSYCEDPETFGLHLNNAGYEKWFKTLGPLIRSQLDMNYTEKESGAK